MSEVGSIYVRIGAKIDDFKNNLTLAEKSLNKFGLNIRKIGKELTIAGGVVVGAMALAIKKTADFGDELNDLRQKTGISAKTLSSLKLAADQSGTSLGGLALGMKGLSLNMLEAKKGTSAAATAFASLGINVNTGAGKLKGLDVMLLEVADKFSKMEDGAMKSALATQIFGRAGNELIPMLNQGADGLQAAIDKARQLGIVMTDEDAAACDKFNDSLVTLKASIQGVFQRTIVESLPILTDMADRLTNFFAEVGKTVSSHAQDIARAVLTAFKLIVKAVEGVILAFNAMKFAIFKIGETASIFLIKQLTKVAIVTELLSSKFHMFKGLNEEVTGAIKDLIIIGMEYNQKSEESIDTMSDVVGSFEKMLGELDKVGNGFQANTNKTGVAIAAVNTVVTEQAAVIKKAKEAIVMATIALNSGAISWGHYGKVVSEAQASIESFSDKAMLKGLPEAIQRTGNALEDLKYAPKDAVPYIIAFAKYYNISIEEAKKKIREIAPEWSRSVDETNGQLSSMQTVVVDSWTQMTDQIRGIWQAGLLEMLQGTKTFGDLLQNTFSAIGSAVSESIFKSFTKAGSKLAESLGMFAGPVGAAVGAVAGSLISLIGGLFKAKPKKTAEERMAEELTKTIKNVQMALSNLGKISEATAKAIAEDMQKGMEGYVAVSKHFADVIRDVGVNQQNINDLWQRSVWIIDEVKNGMLDASEGTKTLGESFKLLVDGAKKLGQEGSQAMVDFIKRIRESGLEIAEVTEYVLDQLGKIPSALATIVKNIYMPTTPIKALEKELDKLTEKLKGVKEGTDEWKTITDRISEINKELNLSNKLLPKTARDLEAMGHIATATFQAMLANGKTLLQALDALKEPLQELSARYKALGLEIPKFLQPLIGLERLAEKFPAAFQNMSSALNILDALRNSAYLTQDTFNSLLTVVNDFAHVILKTSGNLNKFMKTAHLTQTQVQALLPIISQFVGAAAIFGLGIPSWMKTFVTKQLGVDWDKFKDTAKNMASTGIATVEQLKNRIKQAKELHEKNKSIQWQVMQELKRGLVSRLGEVIRAIQGLPGEINAANPNPPAPPPIPPTPGMQHGGFAFSPRTVVVGEVPEVVMPLDKLGQLLKTGIRVEIQPVVIPRGDQYVIEFLQKKIEHGNIRIPITAVG